MYLNIPFLMGQQQQIFLIRENLIYNLNYPESKKRMKRSIGLLE